MRFFFHPISHLPNTPLGFSPPIRVAKSKKCLPVSLFFFLFFGGSPGSGKPRAPGYPSLAVASHRLLSFLLVFLRCLRRPFSPCAIFSYRHIIRIFKSVVYGFWITNRRFLDSSSPIPDHPSTAFSPSFSRKRENCQDNAGNTIWGE